MAARRIGITLRAAHETFAQLLRHLFGRMGIEPSENASAGKAEVILDFPLTWAFTQLDTLNSIEKARTLVVTQGVHPAYLDCLASYHISGVVLAIDEPAVLSGIYAAAAAQRVYQWKSGLTYMELRISRLLIKGFDTKQCASELRVSFKTVNAHVSNILSKLELDNRTQLVAALLAGREQPRR